MIRPLRANGVPQGVLIAANRPTFAGESRRKCPRNRSGSLERWVFGKSQGLLRRAIVAVSPVLGRVGCGRHDLGCWVARVSAGALQPESDSECPLSLQHAVAVASLRKGRLDGSPSPGETCHAHHAHRFSRSRPVRGERTSLGKGSDRRRVLDLGRTSQAARCRSLAMACHQRASGAQAHDCPGFDTTWQGVPLAGRVRDCVVRARVFDCEDRQQRRPSRRSVGRASAMKK